jgi:Rod binding domain-containing protein
MDSVFQQFVGETFYQMMLKSLRNMHDKPAYLHGGQAESLFQSQLDQEIASRLAQTEIGSFSRDLYQSFQAQIKNPI